MQPVVDTLNTGNWWNATDSFHTIELERVTQVTHGGAL